MKSEKEQHIEQAAEVCYLVHEFLAQPLYFSKDTKSALDAYYKAKEMVSKSTTCSSTFGSALILSISSFSQSGTNVRFFNRLR